MLNNKITSIWVKPFVRLQVYYPEALQKQISLILITGN
ncbi:hypothetical protein PARMER_03208 [Parabacteroides merdae ATCC 43184]|nr:hypothetical protein PARMER_03208 [Parabacteroides merdae ATCC 43184]